MDINRKTYFITGASSDVGLAYIEYIDLHREEPCKVIAHYHSSKEALIELQTKLQQVELECVAADLGVKEDVDRLILYVKNSVGCPDYILHFPASKYEAMTFKNFNWDNVEKEINIQVRSIAEIMSSFLPLMTKMSGKNRKVVVMLTSYVYNVPPKYMSHYITAKYALLGLMKSAAIEYAQKNININGVSPSMMQTKFLSNMDERQIEIQARNSVRKRNLEVKDVIPTIDFLVSEGSDCMYGAIMNLSAGEIMV